MTHEKRGRTDKEAIDALACHYVTYLYLGRCTCWRSVHLPRYDEEVTLEIGNFDQGEQDIFSFPYPLSRFAVIDHLGYLQYCSCFT